MKYFYELNLKVYDSYTDEELLELWKNNDDENARVVLAKRKHKIKGDVYLHNGFISNLKMHLEQNPNSKATTILEAGAEYLTNLVQV